MTRKYLPSDTRIMRSSAQPATAQLVPDLPSEVFASAIELFSQQTELRQAFKLSPA